jgi:hypothetical protein
MRLHLSSRIGAGLDFAHEPILGYDPKAMPETVELFSATDPPYVTDRHVRYYLEFRGTRSAQPTEHAPVLAWATALCAEHDAVLIDRSDKDSGYLRRVLEAETRGG